LFPDYFSRRDLPIPERDNSLPDLLDEALFNLRWMMTMQDPSDGGVYHKLTSKSFHQFVMPHEADLPRYILSKSTAAALNLSAVCAKASRIFRNFEHALPGFSDSCLSAAVSAYAWAMDHPEIIFKNPEDIRTGEYSDTILEDEFLWARTELALVKGDLLPLEPDDPLAVSVGSWSDVGVLGVCSAISADRLDSHMKGALLSKGEELLKQYDNSAYPISMTDFVWGSNSVALNQGILLYHCHLLNRQMGFFEPASASLDYVLGCNATGYCFVTGFGSLSPQNIHDRRSDTDGVEGPLPGYLVGGPNTVALEDCGEGRRPHIPALSYIDERCSYSTNEIAINWQAALSFMVHAVQLELRNLNPTKMNDNSPDN
jgi:endoglucanase